MKIPKVGAVTAKNLVAHCGSAEQVFRASLKELKNITGIGDAIAQNIVNQSVLKWAEREVEFIEQNGIKILFHTDKDFPKRLTHINDAPFLLFYKGEANLNAERVLSIVGTRKPTPYGLTMCERIVEGLLQYNPLIISGLAYGIDAAAHRNSLHLGMTTVGILGNGMKRIYPSEHSNLAERMMEEGGGILTEYPSDQEPDREHFPMRNRIIAGMSDAMLVIETAKSGGSIISANLAHGYDRDLFALAGRANDKYSAGCNWLIKTQRAQLIENAEDIAYFMRWDELDRKKQGTQTQLFTELSENQQLIVNILKQKEQTSIDELNFELTKTPSEVASLLLELEFMGIVRSLPGKRFALLS
jgi:DNA processing protein